MSVAAETGERPAVEPAPAPRRSWWRRAWLPALCALLLALFVAPALHAGYRGDDTWTSETRGHLIVSGESLVETLWEAGETFIDSGRPNILGTTQGLFFSWALNDQPLLYHAVLILLTAASAALLYALTRELGAARSVAVLVTLLVAGNIQFRSFHDAMLGYWGSTQLMLAFVLASLLFFARALRSGERRDMVIAFLLFLPAPLLYEGAYPLVAIHLALALIDRRGVAAWRAASPFLLCGILFVVLSLWLRMRAPGGPVPGYEVGGGPWAALGTWLGQLFAPVPGSTFVFRAEHANFIALGGSPTPAELLAGAWRGLLVAAAVVAVCWHVAWRESTKPTPSRVLWSLGATGALLWTTSVLAVSFAPKYQFELVAGKGHLPTLVQSFGFGLVVAALLLAVLPVAARRSRVALGCTVLAVAGLLGFGTAVNGYNNVRVVALEIPVVEARELAETAADRGVLDSLPAGGSVVLSERDTRWNTGSWAQVPSSLEAMLADRTGRVYDGRILPAGTELGCPAGTPDPTECAGLDDEAVWLRIRPNRRGGSVIAGHITRPTLAPYEDAVDAVRVYTEGEGSPPLPPRLIGSTATARPWTSEDLDWQLAREGDGWAVYDAEIDGPQPLGNTLDDAAAEIDFTAQPPSEQLVRLYGTKRLLP